MTKQLLMSLLPVTNWNDYQPYLYKTEDYGGTWKTISDNFPDGEITRVHSRRPDYTTSALRRD